MDIEFPSSFLWGAAISSYQTEGENFNTDWFAWEKEKNLEPAGGACGHYSLFKQDFQLALKLNLNSLRLSFEWARLNPEPRTWNEEAFIHYLEVINALRNLQLEPLVSLHHFTNPLWFVKQNGWLDSKNIDFFLAYVQKVAKFFKDKIEYWLIFNEPLVYMYNGFIRGIWPPGIKSESSAKKVLQNITAAYITCYEEIKRIYAPSLESRVSFSKHVRIFEPCPRFSFGLNSLSAFIRDNVFNLSLLEDLAKKNKIDFIAINYYCKEYVHFRALYGAECAHTFHPERKNILDWYVYPEGLYKSLCRLKKFNLPILVTENGTAEENDTFYEEYLLTHIASVARAIRNKVDVRGYLWWSLLDNFEWDKGFGPRFGLIEVDYKTFQRRIRPFALTYAKICKENRLEI